MRQLSLIAFAIPIALGCGDPDPQNSVFCGLTQQEAGFRIMDQFPRGHALLTAPPDELRSDAVPTRALGYPTGLSIGVEADSGWVALDFQGEGLPGMPGFGVALVDDSSEVFRGVVILETAPGRGFPQIGTISTEESTVTLPLFGMRIHWASVSNAECPLFAVPDSSPAP